MGVFAMFRRKKKDLPEGSAEEATAAGPAAGSAEEEVSEATASVGGTADDAAPEAAETTGQPTEAVDIPRQQSTGADAGNEAGEGA
uniref:hypothetical protein n=1 Tax=Streptomyces sp. TaxID=1931 RepID=UPI00281184F2